MPGSDIITAAHSCFESEPDILGHTKLKSLLCANIFIVTYSFPPVYGHNPLPLQFHCHRNYRQKPRVQIVYHQYISHQIHRIQLFNFLQIASRSQPLAQKF